MTGSWQKQRRTRLIPLSNDYEVQYRILLLVRYNETASYVERTNQNARLPARSFNHDF